MDKTNVSTKTSTLAISRWGRYFQEDQPYRWFFLLAPNSTVPLVRLPEECWNQVHTCLTPVEQLAVVTIDRFHYGMHRYNLVALDPEHWPNPRFLKQQKECKQQRPVEGLYHPPLTTVNWLVPLITLANSFNSFISTDVRQRFED